MKRTFFCMLCLICVFCLPFGCKNNKTEELPEKPESFQLVSPEINSETNRQPTLSWTKSNGAVSYKIQVCTDTDFSVMYFQKTIPSDSLSYSLETVLDGNRMYYWRVVAIGRTGKTRVASNSPYLITTEYSYLNLSARLRDNMVIQRNSIFNVTGTAKKNKTVTATFDGQTKNVVSDSSNGSFCIPFNIGEASSSVKTIAVSSENETLTVSNAVIGDVILFCGQSNIQWVLADSDYLENDLNAPDNLRLFYQNDNPKENEQISCAGGYWFSSDGQVELNYSALGYMFGSMLQNYNKNIPIGILFAAKGDTHIQQWMSKDAYNGEFRSVNNGYGGNVYYNGMLAPIVGNEVSAVVWYQGENNAWNPSDYSDLLVDFVGDMRIKLNNDETPFFIIQLPSYDTDIPENIWAEFRLVQAEAVKRISNASLIVTCDGGDVNQIHPKMKRYIAQRLLSSYKKFVLDENISVAYPGIQSAIKEGNNILLSFSDSEGLYASGSISGFEVASSNLSFIAVSAVINENGTITLDSENISDPHYIRYAYKNAPFVNIFNKQNLPLQPFIISL